MFESQSCYLCGGVESTHFIDANEDLTGKPGTFHFVTCVDCGLRYQNPRVDMDHIKDFYDEEYIAHRKKGDWGLLGPLYEWAMGKHDRDKRSLVGRYVDLSERTRVLDVGCAVGSFLTHLGQSDGCQLSGVDFKDLSAYPGMDKIDFHLGLFYDQDLPKEHFDLITMWHYLEHDYDPIRSLKAAGELLSKEGRLVIEVPRLDSVSFTLYKERWPGLQAPQHTVLFDKEHLLRFLEEADLELVEYLPWGAFPAYFYLFTGAAFKLLKGKGLNLDRWIYPYFAGQLLMTPVLLAEKHLNLAMQTVVCKRRSP
jgi:2-polyprenyl-3-methyl-5-hydroxy-6-metoxy-1,4-benzoquinol methylase